MIDTGTICCFAAIAILKCRGSSMCASAAVYFKITNRTLHTLKKRRHFKTAIAPEQKFLPTVPGIELQKTDL